MPEKPIDCCFTAIQTNNAICAKCEHRSICLEELDIEYKKTIVKAQRIIKTDKTGKREMFIPDPNDAEKVNNFVEIINKLKAALTDKEISVEADSDAFMGLLHEYLDNYEIF